MRYWTGAAFSIFGLWLVWSGLAHRHRVIAMRRRSAIAEPAATGLAERPMTVFGEIMRPIIIFGLAVFALKATVAYFLLGGSRILSLFDLAGLLFLVGAYGVWLTLTTKYRILDDASTKPALAAAPNPVADELPAAISAQATREKQPVFG